MNVGRRMSHPVFTVQPDTPITKAHDLMAKEKIHRAPVVKNGRLVGIITENDVQKAFPSSVTSLSVWEITSLIEKIRVHFPDIAGDSPEGNALIRREGWPFAGSAKQ